MNELITVYLPVLDRRFKKSICLILFFQTYNLTVQKSIKICIIIKRWT